jgi:decaprenylphospho-beta-D-erythro-pentofuranosid-2-ulose 2-reductase
MKRILIVGATSAIAQATARLWAGRGYRLYLLGRDAERLSTEAADLRVRGAESVQFSQLDFNNFDHHTATLNTAVNAMGGIDVVLIAHGTLGDQKACEQDFSATLQELNTNMISVISLLTHLANRFEDQHHGTIAIISSVAGDRGRQSNYIYGTAKGAVTLFAQGLRQRLYKSGVQVLTIKPGFVDTPMTTEFKKNLLWVKPEVIARCIDGGVENGREVVYAPMFWRWVMTLIRSVPEKIFKRLNI